MICLASRSAFAGLFSAENCSLSRVCFHAVWWSAKCLMLMLTMSILGAVLQPSKVFGRLLKDDAQDKQQTPPDTSGFRDGARHWRRIRDENRVIQPRPEHPAWKPHQMAEIAENLLLFQRANGGWPKDYDMQAVLNEDEQKKILDTRDRDDTSFDNRNVFPQVKYLAEMYHRTGVAAYGTGCERGLDFMLRAQYPNGGFPQWFPGGKGYHRHITYNDGAMMGVMRTLRDAAVGRDHFEWLDAERRDRAAAAVRLGTDCILRTQISVGGRLTALLWSRRLRAVLSWHRSVLRKPQRL
jgi:hypothetical protein